MERTDEVRIVDALLTLAGAFTDDGMIDDLTRDISRIADALETLADCVRQDVHGTPYFNISPEAE